MFYLDPLYLVLAIPGLLLGLWAQMRVKGTFNKYANVRTTRNLTGAEVARYLLDNQGLQDVRIEQVQGMLSDHYDPRARVLRLSPAVYGTPSVSAAGVAAHETGHAIQHSVGYGPLQIRSAIVPVVQFSSSLAPILIIIGLLLRFTTLAWIGVIFFAAAVVFSLITLPVEFDASRRAKALLDQGGLMSSDELKGVDKVLDAAGWTYVAAAVAAVGQLLYYVLLLTGGGRRRS
ncbi:MAG: zinc metallopeptidase [Candidatus Promineofilum sp.]|nr:zinc metallopeptidase [Promineifilum sp.]MCW5863341.1 zinc metallopeptidase [Anaerolineae bacterium]